MSDPSFSANLYSTLNPIATNQNFEALENVTFTILCSGTEENYSRIFERQAVVISSKKICTTNEAGRCDFGITDGIIGCFGCPAGSEAIVKASYYSNKLEQRIFGWKGYDCAAPFEKCCYASPAQLHKKYYKNPSNELEPFVFTTYDLTVKVIEENEQEIEGAEIIANSPDAFYIRCKVEKGGSCIIRNIPKNARYNLKASFNGIENSTIVLIDKGKMIKIFLIRPVTKSITTDNITAPILNASEKNKTNKTIIAKPDNITNQSTNIVRNDWFSYLIDKTENLMLKSRKKLKLVFVPIGYSDSESEEFKNISKRSLDFFVSATPFKECKNYSNAIDTIILRPSTCNLKKCSDILGQDKNATENCHSLIYECGKMNQKGFNKIIGICKEASCGTSRMICGAAASIPSTTVISNTFICDDSPYYETVAHELGHAFGLYHIQSERGINDCTDQEGGACQGPNAADCNLSATRRSKLIMAYCPKTEEVGPAAYEYLKTELKKYLEVCR